MRLTLRTLLAYMDDILDPADQEELGRKIESSPFATELIHRTRDAVRRLRLSAPEPTSGADDDVLHSDNNLDANTVAEYLDNVLSPEAVADFERACLEAGPNADMLLAEAASCHHVLTMVLGEPAEVDSDLRRRMYALAESPAAAPQARVDSGPDSERADLAPAAGLAAVRPVAATTLPPERAVDREEAEVPDYLRAAARARQRARRNVVLFVAAMMFGIMGTAWLLWPQTEPTGPRDLVAMGGADQIATDIEVGDTAPAGTSSTTGENASSTGGAAAASSDMSDEAPPFVPSGTPPADGARTVIPPTAPGDDAPPVLPPETDALIAGPDFGPPPPDAPTTPADGAADVSPLPADGGAAAAPGTTVMTPSVDAAPADTPGPPTETPPPATAEGGEPVDNAAVVATDPPMPAAPPETGAAAPPETPADAATGSPTLIADARSDATPVEGPDTPEEMAAATVTPAEAGKAKPVGHYLGNNDLLLRQQAGTWVRLGPRTPLGIGDQVLALPSFRTHVVVSDMNAYLIGGAQLSLMPPGESAGEKPVEISLHLPFGRAILNAGLNGNRVELSLVDQVRVIDLEPSSSLAVDVQRVFLPGADEGQPSPVVVTWYVTSGSVTSGEALKADAPATWTTAAGEDSEPAALEQAPEWVDRDPISGLERGAREDVAAALAAGEPVNISLLELSDRSGLGRRVEVRTLAAHSGAYVGLYEPLVRALGEVDERPRWDSHITALRQAIAREPASVEGIAQAFVIERGEQAANDLMAMLLGFDSVAVGTTREEVQQGALVRLLRWMNDDDLAYRVLASYNVNEITGTNNLGNYRPQHTAAQRERSLRHYWQRLENGELMPKQVQQ